MTTINTQEILSRLIELTSQRDSNTLEISLAQTLFDLVAPGAVVIYRSINLDNTDFSSTLLNGDISRDQITDDLKHALSTCMQSGEPHSFRNKAEKYESVLLYPIKGGKNQTIAVMAILEPDDGVDFHSITEKLLKIYQNFVALIHENERDTLTGLLNRKTFEIKINKILSSLHSVDRESENENQSFHYLAIFDIDHFKKVNDQFGHLIGDEVLLLFSQLMTNNFRSQDYLFRFGGEEFVGLFECPNDEDIFLVLDRFREKVSNYTFPQVGQVTISAGYTKLTDNDVSANLIDRADVALYYAKNHGRNLVIGHEKLIESGELEEKKNIGEIEFF